MLKVPKPTMQSAVVYADCVGIFRDAALRLRLNACGPLIADAEQEFEAKITKGEIWTINREALVNGNVTAEELKKVYTYQMVGHATGRAYYDKLLQAAKHGLCPLCGHRDVTTLDHYLPKMEYPRLAVVPVNLIPACKDCNTGKLSTYPSTPEEETLHPYYDDIEDDDWLMATVNRTDPVSIKFTVARAAGWDDLLFGRVESHFQSFGLKTLYATQSARELSARKLQLTKVFDSGSGSAGVKKLLTEEAESRAMSNRNSWQAALYAGLAADDWFCNEGFRRIGD